MASAPSDDRHLAGEERRIANDGVAYTFHEFPDYGQGHARVKWNSADIHRAGEERQIAYDGGASDVHDAVLVAGFLPPVDLPPVALAAAAGSQCIYSGDSILLSRVVLATVHLQWRFHPTVPRSALSPEVHLR